MCMCRRWQTHLCLVQRSQDEWLADLPSLLSVGQLLLGNGSQVLRRLLVFGSPRRATGVRSFGLVWKHGHPRT